MQTVTNLSNIEIILEISWNVEWDANEETSLWAPERITHIASAINCGILPLVIESGTIAYQDSPMLTSQLTTFGRVLRRYEYILMC